MLILYALSVFALLFWIIAASVIYTGMLKLRRLKEINPIDSGRAPRVSIVVAARNEARKIGDALTTMLRLDYPNYEVIAVNDRSEDGTGDILDELAKHETKLRVVHITELPTGWLGKNYALQQGAVHTDSEYLLFTDADVHYAPGVLSRAMRYAVERDLDHLCTAPKLVHMNFLMKSMVPIFSIIFLLNMRPWEAGNKDKSGHMGVGAFNLVRKKVFDKLKGIETIRLRPDEDVKLGKIIKAAGFRQEYVENDGMLTVEWYRNAREMIHGLEKNSFAFMEYSVIRLLAGSLISFFIFYWPIAGLFIASDTARAINALALLPPVFLSSVIARRLEFGWWHGFSFPLGVIPMVVAMLNSMLVTLSKNGIVWRDTFYPLELLRKNKV